MEAVLSVTFPVFAIIACGYLAARIGLLNEHASAALNSFAYWFALPALFLKAMATTPLAQIFDWPFIFAYLIGTAATVLIVVAIARSIFGASGIVTTLHALTASFANTGYLGVPLFLALFGAAGAFPVILISVVHTLVLFIPVVAILELVQRDSASSGLLEAFVRPLIFNPFVPASAVGIAVNLIWAGAIPGSVANFLNIAGAAAGPCALFALGLFLYGKPVTRGIREIAWLTLAKLALHPTLVWIAAAFAFGLHGQQVRDLVLIAALPAAALSFVLAQKHGVFEQRAAGVALITTILGVGTLTTLFGFFEMAR